VELVEPEVVSGLCSLSLAYEDLSQLGVDRWLAMLAAYKAVEGALVLVSAGTAVTVDCVDGGGRHLGGLIAPGWGLLKSVLVDKTERLSLAADIEIAGGSQLGIDTRSCLESGVSSMLLSFVSSAVTTFGAGTSTRLITGGDAEKVSRHIELDFECKENLVLDGLAIYCAEVESGRLASMVD
jgi:type III pantothenate kinase